MDAEDDPAPAIGTTGARFGGAYRRRRSARRKAGGADRPHDPPPPGAEADTVAIPVVPPMAPGEDPGAADGPVVGLTGARFGGARRKRRPRTPPAAPPPVADAVPQPPDPVAAPAAEVAPPAAEVAPPAADVASPAVETEEPVAGGSAFVRPYVFTGGRTRAAFELSIETLVSADARVAPDGLTGEHRAVLDLCREPRSLAELAAHAGVPLGVARVLVGDLAARGAVTVHHAAGPDLALMRRVLSGLKRL